MRHIYHWTCPRCHALYAALDLGKLAKKVRKHRCLPKFRDEQLTLDGERLPYGDYPEKFIHLPKPPKPEPESERLKYRQKSLQQWLSR